MVNIPTKWLKFLEHEMELMEKILFEVDQIKKKETVFPPTNQIFRALELTDPENVKIIIIGQDPYHQEGQANGLAFSVNEGISFPPSLKNIFSQLSNELNIAFPKSGNLEKWSKQGVLLLNNLLTVSEGKPNSHKQLGWEKLTNTIIQKLSEERDQLIFMLWGGEAKKKQKLINSKKHTVLTSGHPSPLSANRGFWFGNNHFSKANEILYCSGQKLIDWQIE